MTGGDNDMITRTITFLAIIGLACFYFSTIGVYYGKDISPAVPSIGMKTILFQIVNCEYNRIRIDGSLYLLCLENNVQ